MTGSYAAISSTAKALSVRQPWAEALALGIKRIENRTWRTSYRGPLLIHAGRRATPRSWFNELPAVREALDAAGILDGYRNLTLGAIIGRVDLYDCVQIEDMDVADPFAAGPWCWLVRNAVRFRKPIPMIGSLSLFNVPARVLSGQ